MEGKSGAAAGDGTDHNSSKNRDGDASLKKDEKEAIREETAASNINNNTTTVRDTKQDDDDDDDEMMDIRVPSGMTFLEGGGEDNSLIETIRPATIIPQKPTENLKVDDQAILNCWNLTVASHEAAADTDATTTTAASLSSSSPSPSPSLNLLENEYRWEASDKAASSAAASSTINLLKNWQPKSLALPTWAVDPFEMSFVIGQTKTNKESARQQQHKRIKR